MSNSRPLKEKNHQDDVLVSVIIPTFNRAQIISTSIKSVLNQSYTNLEIIIVDDSSTDNTKAVIDSHQDPRITYIYHDYNKGGAAARNTGLDAAQGDFIAFLDSDDAWLHNKLELQISYILSQPYPNKVASYTQLFYMPSGIREDSYFNSENKPVYPSRGKKPDQSVGDYLFCCNGLIQTSTLILHKDLIQSIRFRKDLRKHQDWDLCLRLESCGAIFLYLEKPLSLWNGDSSFEHVGDTHNYQISEQWIEEYKDYISLQARVGFFLMKILPGLIKNRERPRLAQNIIYNGFRFKLLSLKQFIKLTYRNWFHSLF